MRHTNRIVGGLFSGLAALTIGAGPASAATIVIVNGNDPGVGFNDPTPVAPVGGNAGTTLGEQRLIAFQRAADLWGAELDSAVEIRVAATFEPLFCTATSAVLGSAGTISIFANFPGAPFADTWYHSALADRLSGVDLAPDIADLRARFNVNLGSADCLAGVGWYLGLDNNQGNQIDLVTVLLHEFAHGLGFSQFASVTTGSMIQGLPDTYNRQLLDTSTGLTWAEMTNAERVASAINSRRVVWTGAAVTSEIPDVLSLGTPLLQVDSPASIAGAYAVGAAAFGPPLSSPGITGTVVQALDAGPSTTDACSAITNAAAVAGKIALVDRGTCAFTVKVKNAQDAGAIAVIVADNVAGGPPAGLGGADPTITIPSVRITLPDGITIKAQLGAGVDATLGVDPTVYSGANPFGFALMNAPNPVQPGSSISHWDPIAFRNQLMEPSINADLTYSLKAPEDLSLALMRDVGWAADEDLDGVLDDDDACPGSDLAPTVVIDSCDSGVPNTLFTDGCTVSDNLRSCADGAANHGGFVSCAASYTNLLKKQDLITGAQKGAVQSCAAEAAIP